MPKKPPFIDLDTQVLILAHYFPPSNSTASDRTYYWLKHLQNNEQIISELYVKTGGLLSSFQKKTSLHKFQLKIDYLKK